MQRFLEIIHAEPTFCLADSPGAIRRAKSEGKLAHILLSQDALFVGANPKALLLWKQLGLRICQLTYNEKNLLGDGCLERHDGGLSQLGRVMVREMERYGITIDLTHAGRRTFMDICAAATEPRSSPRTPTRKDGRRQPPQHRRRPDARRGGVGRGRLRHHLGAAHLGRHARDADPRRLAGAASTTPWGWSGSTTSGSRPTRWARWGPIPETRRDPDALPYGSVTDAFDRWPEPPDSNNRQPAEFNGIQDFPRPWWRCSAARAWATRTSGKLLGGNLFRVFDATWKPDWLG